MDAVAAADGDGVILCSKARRLQRGEQAVDIGDQDMSAAARELHVESRCRARPTRSCPDARSARRADDFGEMGQEGDDVMLGLALDLVDALDIEGRVLALFPDRLRRLLRDGAEFRQRIAGMASISNQMRKRVSATRWRPFPDGNSEGSFFSLHSYMAMESLLRGNSQPAIVRAFETQRANGNQDGERGCAV
jgi:hypothetical protein